MRYRLRFCSMSPCSGWWWQSIRARNDSSWIFHLLDFPHPSCRGLLYQCWQARGEAVPHRELICCNPTEWWGSEWNTFISVVWPYMGARKPNQINVKSLLQCLGWSSNSIVLSIFSNQQKQLPIITLLHFCISYFREAAKSKGSISSLAALWFLLPPTAEADLRGRRAGERKGASGGCIIHPKLSRATDQSY